MGHGYGAGWAAGIFWLFIAVAVAVAAWEKIRRNAEKHETLRRIIEKTGTVDESKLQDLFNPSGPDWMRAVPGEAYRGLRIAGTIVLSVAAGGAVCFLILDQAGVATHLASMIGLGVSSAVAVVGAGLFLSSRFAEPPPSRGNEPPAR